MASHDAGVEVTCPGCSQVVLQKAMIPVLGEGGPGIRYLCAPCARALIVPPGVPSGEAALDLEGADGPDGGASRPDNAGTEVSAQPARATPDGES